MSDTEKQSTLSLGLRAKLALGFAGLLAILAAVGAESISLLTDLGGSIDVILRENYRSVIACDRMKEALERLDSGALFALAGEGEQGRRLAAENRPRFEAALQAELHNITLPGEGARAERLRQLDAAYQPVLDRVLAPATPPQEARRLYFSQLYPVFQQIKATAEEILAMNQENMVSANDRARRLAAAASRRMAVLLLAGTAFAGLCVAFLSRTILGPLERLTQAARQIEAGQLDLRVPVTSGDEVGQLGAAFNAMAGGLRELRESDQARLLRSRAAAQHAIDSLPLAVAVLGTDRTVEMANRPAAGLLGLAPGRPVAPPHAGWLLPLLDRVEHGRLQERIPETGMPLPGADRDRFYLPRGAALAGPQGRPEGFILTVEDVTGRRRESEVQAGLLANAARDLATALRPMDEALEALRAPAGAPLTPEQRELVERARSQAERIDAIATHLLAVSRRAESRRRLHLEPVAPGDLIAAAVAQTAGGAPDRRERLIEKESPALPRVLADRERAAAALAHLLRNAFAQTAQGGTVTIGATAEDGRVRFSVTDTGRAIPREHRERIFEPFHELPGEEDLAGTGLGLATAGEIVQAHGGEIHCESEEGRGTTFWLTLPAAPEG